MPDITIQDVARAAGVSAASVSNLLNGRHDRMRSETRLRIETVIAELGYRPNPIARQLKTGHAPTLGLLVPTVSNPFFGELSAAIQESAQARGYHVLLCNTLRRPERESDFAEQLLRLGVRGFIAASAFGDPHLTPALVRRGLSVVHFDVRLSDVPPTGVDIVSIDNRPASYLATTHLADLGHRTIAYVTAPATVPNRVARLQGYRDALRDRGLDEPIVWPLSEPPTESGFEDVAHGELGRQAGIHLAARTPRPTGIVAVHDLVAIGVLSGLREAGLEIPGDVSVVGINDIHLASFTNPSLTTVRQPLGEMSELAVTRLLQRLADPGKPSSETLFAPALIQRTSSAAPGSATWPLARMLGAPKPE